jgi:hypothetical protein
MADETPLLGKIRSHFDKLLEHGLDRHGKVHTAMWMATLDTRTGRYPEDDRRPPEIPRRHYRAIDAPKGCSMYWDQPALVAAHALSGVTGTARYAKAAAAYVSDFLERCVARNGSFLWGNHYFWDAFRDCTVKFKGEEEPRPVDFEKEDGDYHEARPLSPAWDLFWKVSPEKTERAIRAYVEGSLFDAQSGGFNRHADRKKGCAFIESGGILAESLGYLYARTQDAALLETARRIAAFSCAKRDAKTALVPVNSTVTRWDRYCASTEVGLWGGSLLRATTRFGGQADWQKEVALAIDAYLERGYDEQKKAYYGKLVIEDGTPVIGERRWPGDSDLSDTHRPDDYSDIWRPLFPAHDYPMSLAECSLDLYKRTRKDRYRTACDRWKTIIEASLPARQGKGAYAEHYGRCIHFLLGGADAFSDPAYAKLARRVANEALATLFDEGMFRSHPGEHRYDAVDGVGFLLLALLWLETGRPPADMGFGW